MAKIGRNEPCPCGSGKKYKKCCMEKDQARARFTGVMPAPKPAARAPVKPRDAAVAEVEERRARRSREEYEERAAAFARELDNAEEMDGEIAFDRLDSLFYRAAEFDDRGRFEDLAEELRRRYPDIYAAEARYILGWRITNALAEGRSEDVRAFGMELAAIAGEAIDELNRTAEQLAFHGYQRLLRQMRGAGWPEVRASKGIVPWGIEEFGEETASAILFDEVEQHPGSVPSAADLLPRLEPYSSLDREQLERYLLALTGRLGHRWTPEDVDFEPVEQPVGGAPHRDEDEAVDPDWERRRRNLHDLSIEFLGYLRREEGFAYCQGDLGRDHLLEYLLRRAAGELGPRYSMLETALPPSRRRQLADTPAPENMLCPDYETLDRYLGRLVGIMEPRRYRITATLLVIPPWLRFLESRGLITADLRERTLDALTATAGTVFRGWRDNYPADPALARTLENWPEIKPPTPPPGV